tara:strand:+ start:6039 stop:8585 length:2547 start_codon:yes stop_codon:yes gene_type:complete
MNPWERITRKDPAFKLLPHLIKIFRQTPYERLYDISDTLVPFGKNARKIKRRLLSFLRKKQDRHNLLSVLRLLESIGYSKYKLDRLAIKFLRTSKSPSIIKDMTSRLLKRKRKIRRYRRKIARLMRSSMPALRLYSAILSWELGANKRKAKRIIASAFAQSHNRRLASFLLEHRVNTSFLWTSLLKMAYASPSQWDRYRGMKLLSLARGKLSNKQAIPILRTLSSGTPITRMYAAKLLASMAKRNRWVRKALITQTKEGSQLTKVFAAYALLSVRRRPKTKYIKILKKNVKHLMPSMRRAHLKALSIMLATLPFLDKHILDTYEAAAKNIRNYVLPDTYHKSIKRPRKRHLRFWKNTLCQGRGSYSFIQNIRRWSKGKIAPYKTLQTCLPKADTKTRTKILSMLSYFARKDHRIHQLTPTLLQLAPRLQSAREKRALLMIFGYIGYTKKHFHTLGLEATKNRGFYAFANSIESLGYAHRDLFVKYTMANRYGYKVTKRYLAKYPAFGKKHAVNWMTHKHRYVRIHAYAWLKGRGLCDKQLPAIGKQLSKQDIPLAQKDMLLRSLSKCKKALPTISQDLVQAFTQTPKHKQQTKKSAYKTLYWKRRLFGYIKTIPVSHIRKYAKLFIAETERTPQLAQQLIKMMSTWGVQVRELSQKSLAQLPRQTYGYGQVSYIKSLVNLHKHRPTLAQSFKRMARSNRPLERCHGAWLLWLSGVDKEKGARIIREGLRRRKSKSERFSRWVLRTPKSPSALLLLYRLANDIHTREFPNYPQRYRSQTGKGKQAHIFTLRHWRRGSRKQRFFLGALAYSKHTKHLLDKEVIRKGRRYINEMAHDRMLNHIARKIQRYP